MAVYEAEDWEIINRQDTQSSRQSGNRATKGATERNANLATLAGLFGFGTAEEQHQPFPDVFDICQIKSD